jgi:hypothetical protein
LSFQAYEDSSPTIPLYFILSPGADVVSDVDKLALKKGKAKGVDYHNISLGQGQDKVAIEKLDMGARQGHWVFLNNVHLMPKFLTVVDKKIEEYSTSAQVRIGFIFIHNFLISANSLNPLMYLLGHASWIPNHVFVGPVE